MMEKGKTQGHERCWGQNCEAERRQLALQLGVRVREDFRWGGTGRNGRILI